MTVLISKLLYTANFISAIGLLFCKASNVKDETTVSDPGRGFGDHFEWMTLEDGLQAARNENKPLMFLIHKSWCGACKALKPRFAASREIKNLSKHFVMVNAMDDEEPTGDVYAPDGSYIPRILFIAPDGKVLTEYYNEEGNTSYKFFYSDPSSIISSMKRVLNSFKQTRQPDEL